MGPKQVLARVLQFGLILLFLAAGVFGVIGFLEAKKAERHSEALQQELAQREQELVAFEGENQRLTQQLDRLRQERTELQRRAKLLDQQLEATAQDLSQIEEQLAQAGERREQLADVKAELESELAYVRAERDMAQGEAEEAERQEEELARAIEEVRVKLDAVKRDHAALASKLAEGGGRMASGVRMLSDSRSGPSGRLNILVDSGAAHTAPTEDPEAMPELDMASLREQDTPGGPTIHGQLVQVNDTHGFVVLNKGSSDGVEVGMLFEVFRESLPIGRVRAIRVRNRVSACDVLTSEPLQAGDRLVQVTVR
ncbi:MAG TPA: hypothetical protein VGB20_05305 [bacterium]